MAFSFGSSAKPRRLLWAVVAVVITGLLVGGFFGYRAYRDWANTRRQITAYINTNVAEYNRTSTPAKILVEELNLLVEFDPENTADTTQRIAEIRRKITEIEELNQQIDASREAIEPGEIEPTQNLSRSLQDTLSTKRFTLESLNGFLVYQICLIENATEQSINLEEFTTQITNFSEAEGVSVEDRNGFIQTANAEIRINLELLTQFDGCFEGEYANFLTTELRAVRERDERLYLSYSEALEDLGAGLSANNSEQVLRATNELVALSEQEFSLFSSEEIKDAVAEPTTKIQLQADVLEREEARLQDQLNQLKAEYLLESI